MSTHMTACLIACILVSFAGSTAFGSLDHDTDQFGVYFDTNGNRNCEVVLPYDTTDVYVLLMNPGEEVRGFEFSYTVNTSAFVVRLVNEVPGSTMGCLQYSENMASGFYKCGISTPLSPAMVLVHWRFLPLEPASVEFRLGPAPNPALSGGLPVIYGGTHVVRLAGVASGDPSLPVATWGGPGCPVDEQVSCFGTIKGLFR